MHLEHFTKGALAEGVKDAVAVLQHVASIVHQVALVVILDSRHTSSPNASDRLGCIKATTLRLRGALGGLPHSLSLTRHLRKEGEAILKGILTCNCADSCREGLAKVVRKAGSRLQIPADGPACVIHSGDNCGLYLTLVGVPRPSDPGGGSGLIWGIR